MIVFVTHYFVAQSVGVCAVLVALSVYQLNARRTMLRLSAIAALLYAVSFFMLGAMTGAAMNLLGGARCYAFSKVKPSRKNGWVLLVFLAGSLAATITSWQGPVSLLAMGGSMLGAIAFWQKDAHTIRNLALIVPPLWFAYDALAGSYPGMFVEVFNIVSILIGRYRFDSQKAVAQSAE